jgi:hypothetical protein
MCTLSSVVGWCDQVRDYGTHDTPVIMVTDHALLMYIFQSIVKNATLLRHQIPLCSCVSMFISSGLCLPWLRQASPTSKRCHRCHRVPHYQPLDRLCPPRQGSRPSSPYALRRMSHPFNDQMECILLCVPRDQSHIS